MRALQPRPTEYLQVAATPKRRHPQYVPYHHDGVDYVVDTANREVLRDWVAVERQTMLPILQACLKAEPQVLAS